MCIGGAIGCLLPLYFQDSYIEKFPLRKAVSSFEFTIFSAVTFALAAPLILDQIMDFISYANNGKIINLKTSIMLLFLTDVEKILFVLGTLIVPVGTIITNNSDKLAFTYACCVDCQYMLTIGIVTTSICRYDKGFWPTAVLSISILLQMLGLVSGAFVRNCFKKEPVSRICYSLGFNNFSNVCNIVSSILIILVCIYHLIRIFRRTNHCMKANHHLTNDANKSKEDYWLLILIAYFFATFILLVLIVAPMYPQLILMDVNGLILLSAPFGCFVLFLDVLLMRIAKSEMTDAVVSFVT